MNLDINGLSVGTPLGGLGPAVHTRNGVPINVPEPDSEVIELLGLLIGSVVNRRAMDRLTRRSTGRGCSLTIR